MKTNYKKFTIKPILYILTFSLIVNACSSKEDSSEEPAATVVNENTVSLNDEQIKSGEIKIDTLRHMDIGQELVLNGNIEVPPKGMAKVSAPGGGYVRSANFVPGDYVKIGQTLAVIDNPDLIQMQEDYLLAKANYSYAAKNEARQKSLNQSKATSDKAAEQAQNLAQTQSIMISSLAEKLRTYGINPKNVSPSNIQKTVRVFSPISGYISSVNVNLRQYVSPTEILFEVINNSDIHLVLQAFEKDLQYLHMGQQVESYTNQNPDKKYTAIIKLIGKDISENRSVEVHCHFQNYEPNLIPGTYMNGVVETGGSTSWAIPEAGVVTWEDQQYVFEATSAHTFQMMPVTIGNSENGYTRILSNAPDLAKKRFVTAGAYNLLMALKNVED